MVSPVRLPVLTPTPGLGTVGYVTLEGFSVLNALYRLWSCQGARALRRGHTLRHGSADDDCASDAVRDI